MGVLHLYALSFEVIITPLLLAAQTFQTVWFVLATLQNNNIQALDGMICSPAIVSLLLKKYLSFVFGLE